MLGEAVISLVMGKPFSSRAFAIGLVPSLSESTDMGSSLTRFPSELELPHSGEELPAAWFSDHDDVRASHGVSDQPTHVILKVVEVWYG